MKRISPIQSFVVLTSCYFIGYVYYDYPVYSEGISFWIILLSLFAISIVVVQILNPTEQNDYDAIEKKMDKIYNEDGDFKYVKDGFEVTLKNKIYYIQWLEIEEINYFRTRTFRDTHQNGLQIILKGDSIDLYFEALAGYQKFILKMNDALTIDKSWTVASLDAKQVIKGHTQISNIYKKVAVTD